MFLFLLLLAPALIAQDTLNRTATPENCAKVPDTLNGLLDCSEGMHGTSVITLRDVIEVVADYEVHHPTVPARSEWYGWTEPDAQQIFSIRNADLMIRRKTVIHEITHVSRRLHSQVLINAADEEETVRILSDKSYDGLFGSK